MSARPLSLIAPLVACAALFVASPGRAEPTPPVRAEIDALLARLETSGCTFNRNGAWYPAGEAKAHLLRKLDYFERQGRLASTEQFIEQGASASSSSGQPYLVKCGDAAAVPSRGWLVAALHDLRASGRRRAAR